MVSKRGAPLTEDGVPKIFQLAHDLVLLLLLLDGDEGRETRLPQLDGFRKHRRDVGESGEGIVVCLGGEAR